MYEFRMIFDKKYHENRKRRDFRYRLRRRTGEVLNAIRSHAGGISALLDVGVMEQCLT